MVALIILLLVIAIFGGLGFAAHFLWWVLIACLILWVLGFPLALGYFAILFKFHRGKVKAPAEGKGY